MSSTIALTRSSRELSKCTISPSTSVFPNNLFAVDLVITIEFKSENGLSLSPTRTCKVKIRKKSFLVEIISLIST